MNNISIKVFVSAGELIDKISILKIKMENIKDVNKIDQVKKEYENLLSELQSLNGYDCFLNKMIDINLQLWGVEDRIRKKEMDKEFDDEFIELARSVYKLNDRRFEIKNEINIFYGSHIREQKEYHSYS